MRCIKATFNRRSADRQALQRANREFNRLLSDNPATFIAKTPKARKKLKKIRRSPGNGRLPFPQDRLTFR
jgi:hypothetical protein